MNADRRRKKSKVSHGGGGAVTHSGTPKQLQRKQNGSQPATSSTSSGPPTASRRADNEEGAGIGPRWLTLSAVVTVAAVLAAVLAVAIIVLGWADSGTLSGLHGGGENVDPSTRTAGPPAPPVTLGPGDPQPPHEPSTLSPQDSAPKAQPAPTKPKKPKLLNKFDRAIKEELDAAEKLRKKGSMDEALQAFTELVQTFPGSPRARYGKAQAEDDLAEKQRSNEQLARAIATYAEVADLPDAPAELVQLALRRQANRLQFLGRMRAAVAALRKLVQRYPADVALQNELGVALLLQGDNQGAKVVYEEVLARSPDDGFAKVHFGFILKAENKIAESIPFLRAGLESEAPGTNDGRFYFHLGDALQRMGERDEAYRWYAQGHEQGHFSSVFQRSLYNVRGLKAQPWWTPQETGYTELVKALERGWRGIRDEALAAMDVQSGFFLPEEENLREKGDWAQFTLWQQGRKSESGCRRAPTTCSIMERFPESTGCTRGQVKFSVMHPGTHVWPHTGPTNCRLRLHLGLVIPTPGCRIRCANDTREWQEGKVLIFDDSFEHEVWQDADRARLIFIVDVWHPQLTAHQRRTLSPI